MSGRGDHDLNPGMQVPADRRPAAVLVPIVAREDGLSLLLTKRSETLSVHKGQVSFPGGRVEDQDLNVVDTALRETEEEIGLDRDRVEVLGRLDTYVTRTGFEVVPIVGLVTPPFELKIDPVEVDEAFEVPLSFVLDHGNHQRHSREWQNTTRFFWVLPYRHYYIWGATAGMLVNLADVLTLPNESPPKPDDSLAGTHAAG
ncbi:MAG: CoA pyrophosphatase [Alphaproteobacteria bacterium]|nr:CoA pyrophosphatase [Alphaproteobacteria bacterium]